MQTVQTGPQSASEKLLGRMLKFSPENEGRHVSSEPSCFECSEKQTTRYIDWQTRLILPDAWANNGRSVNFCEKCKFPPDVDVHQGKTFQTDLVKQIMIHIPAHQQPRTEFPDLRLRARFQPERKTSSSSRFWSSSMFWFLHLRVRKCWY